MGLDKIITGITQSNLGRKTCNYVLNPKNEQKVTTGLLIFHQVTCEALGLGICMFNKKMDNESKKHQSISHLIKGTLNLTAVAGVSTATGKFAKEVSRNLNAPDPVKMGVNVGIPLVVSTLVSRFIVPVVVNNVATKLRDKYNEKFEKKDVKTHILDQKNTKTSFLQLNNRQKAIKLDVKA